MPFSDTHLCLKYQQKAWLTIIKEPPENARPPYNNTLNQT